MMALLAVTTSLGLEYLNLSLAERILPLSDGSVAVQFNRTVVTLKGIDAQRVLQWAQQQASQTLEVLTEAVPQPPAASYPTRHPEPTPSGVVRSLDLPSFKAEDATETPKRTEPSWRLQIPLLTISRQTEVLQAQLWLYLGSAQPPTPPRRQGVK